MLDLHKHRVQAYSSVLWPFVLRTVRPPPPTLSIHCCDLMTGVW
jgi:hypothetical protein